jgi:chemotaxis protein histidine kinase CheA
LPIAKAVANAHGGEVRLHSRPGRGTRVSVLLPGYSAIPMSVEAKITTPVSAALAVPPVGAASV